MAAWEFAIVTQFQNVVWVSYSHPDGKVTVTNPWKASNKNQPVFAGILAYLGGGEWELVSVQHGLMNTGSPIGGILLGNDIRAYLKRQVVAGRKTDQPQIPQTL